MSKITYHCVACDLETVHVPHETAPGEVCQVCSYHDPRPVRLIRRHGSGDTVHDLGTYPDRRAACRALAGRTISWLDRSIYAVEFAHGAEYYPDELLAHLQREDHWLAHRPDRVVWG
jgi:hypothetical protein